MGELIESRLPWATAKKDGAQCGLEITECESADDPACDREPRIAIPRADLRKYRSRASAGAHPGAHATEAVGVVRPGPIPRSQ